MLSRVINIGKSKGVIIPKSFLKQCFIEHGINIEVNYNTIVISSVNGRKRTGWAEAFREMAKNGDDELIIADYFDDEPNVSWTWK